MFLDFPLGHTAGRPRELALTTAVVGTALDLLSSDEPGTIVDLPYHWGPSDDWKDDVMRVDVSETGEIQTVDDRLVRHDTPQYQLEADAQAAARTHTDRSCVVCEGVDY